MQSRDEINKKLLHAAMMGDFSGVQAALEADAAVNISDFYGNTALIFASESGYAAVVELLLSQPSIDVNVANQFGTTALMDASINGHIQIVRLLLTHKNINRHQVNQEQKTALVLAYENEHVDIVNLFLTQKETYVRRDPRWNLNLMSATAWTMAVEASYVDIVKLCLAQNHADMRDSIIETGLKAASKGGHVEIARLFLDEKKETKLYKGNPDGSFDAWISAIQHNHIGIIKLFLSHEAVSVDSEALNLGLIESLRLRYDTSLARLFLELPGLDVNYKDVFNITPLMAASVSGHEEIIALLLSKKEIHPSECTPEGMSALKYAIQSGHVEIARLLIEYGEEGMQFSFNDHLLFAVKNANSEILSCLWSRGSFNFFDARVSCLMVLDAASRRKDSMSFFVLFLQQLVDFSAAQKDKDHFLSYLNDKSNFKEIVLRVIENMAMLEEAKTIEVVLNLVEVFFNHMKGSHLLATDIWPYLLQGFSFLIRGHNVADDVRERMVYHLEIVRRVIVDQLTKKAKVDDEAYIEKQKQAAPQAASHRFFQGSAGEVKPEKVLSAQPWVSDEEQEEKVAKLDKEMKDDFERWKKRTPNSYRFYILSEEDHERFEREEREANERQAKGRGRGRGPRQ